MPTALRAGPYRKIRLADGIEAPYYIVPFDKRGICGGPETRQHLIETVKPESYTDIFIFSHGWNNDWTVATSRWRAFFFGCGSIMHLNGL